MSKKYFDNSDDGLCYSLRFYKDLMEEEGETEKFLWEGILEKGEDHFFCSFFLEVGLKSEGSCGKQCGEYKPRNGKNGRCQHSKNTYFPGDKYLLSRNGKKFKLTIQQTDNQ